MDSLNAIITFSEAFVKRKVSRALVFLAPSTISHNKLDPYRRPVNEGSGVCDRIFYRLNSLYPLLFLLKSLQFALTLEEHSLPEMPHIRLFSRVDLFAHSIQFLAFGFERHAISWRSQVFLVFFRAPQYLHWYARTLSAIVSPSYRTILLSASSMRPTISSAFSCSSSSSSMSQSMFSRSLIAESRPSMRS